MVWAHEEDSSAIAHSCVGATDDAGARDLWPVLVAADPWSVASRMDGGMLKAILAVVMAADGNWGAAMIVAGV